jgi:hypothetical protein
LETRGGFPVRPEHLAECLLQQPDGLEDSVGQLSSELLLIGLDDESEAVSYFARALPEWLKTPGAVEWLRENTDERILSQLEQE